MKRDIPTPRPFPLISNSLPSDLSLNTEVDAMEDLLYELSCVRKSVYLEYQHFRSLQEKLNENKKNNEDTNTKPNEEVDHLNHQRKRLLYLFVRDLTKGVSGEVLENKERRDFRKVEKVSLELKIVTWLFVLLLNVGLLFYVYLFAIRQTHSRQSAWFRSFMMWLFFDVFVSSTGMVILIHLLIPLYALSDVSKMKEKILNDLTSFRLKYLRKRNHDQNIVEEKEEKKVVVVPFNAAKYLFPSWRVASLFPDIPESKFILEFTTPWPKRIFGMRGVNGIELSSYYTERIILNAMTRFCLYLFVSFLHTHDLVQDVSLRLFSDCSLVYVMYLMVELYLIHPLFPFLVVFVVVCFISIMLKPSATSNKHHATNHSHERAERAERSRVPLYNQSAGASALEPTKPSATTPNTQTGSLSSASFTSTVSSSATSSNSTTAPSSSQSSSSSTTTTSSSSAPTKSPSKFKNPAIAGIPSTILVCISFMFFRKQGLEVWLRTTS